MYTAKFAYEEDGRLYWSIFDPDDIEIATVSEFQYEALLSHLNR